jgi:hypothetical protein
MLAVLRRADCSHRPHAGDEQARATGLSVDAKGKRGVFYETWSSLDPYWKRIHVPLGSCSRITPEFLARERKNLGETKYREEYLCEFLDTDAAAFSTDIAPARACAGSSTSAASFPSASKSANSTSEPWSGLPPNASI